VELFDIEYYDDLEIWVTGHSRSLKMALFDRPCMTVSHCLLVRHCNHSSILYRFRVTWLRGQSRSLELVPFKSSGAVSYSPSIVTMAVSVAVRDIFSIKKWCDLGNRVRVHSRSLEMAPFDRSHVSSYSPSIVTMALSSHTHVY